jgi:HTH-type transcriptional regulator/antitoxin HigA
MIVREELPRRKPHVRLAKASRKMERRLSMADKRANTIRAVYGKTEDRYLELVRRFPLRPLRSDADLDAAIAVLDGLIDRPALSAPEQDYLDVLSDLVEAYETETIAMRPVGDADLLRFLIDQNGITQATAATNSGIAESTVSEVLAGKRKLNRTQIAKLARYFHVEPGVFLSES